MPLVLEATTASIRQGRSWVLEQARRQGVRDELLPVLVLLTSELLSNAVRHGSTSSAVVELDLRRDRSGVRVQVADGSPERPVERRAALHEGGGRGIAIVRTLAEDWGVEPRPSGGKSVWFRLADHPPG